MLFYIRMFETWKQNAYKILAFAAACDLCQFGFVENYLTDGKNLDKNAEVAFENLRIFSVTFSILEGETEKKKKMVALKFSTPFSFFSFTKN